MTDLEPYRSLAIEDVADYHKIVEVNGCWEVTTHPAPLGRYPRISMFNRRDQTHRVMYFVSTGIDPKGIVVRHTCDNKTCINPNHLIGGTSADNSRDMVERGRSLKGDRHPLRINPGLAASGDRNGSRLHPASRPRGDAHHARRTPEVMARGERHGFKTRPEAHPCYMKAECECGLVSNPGALGNHLKKTGHRKKLEM